MSTTDMQILKRALDFEAKRAPQCWDAARIGAGRADINRLQGAALIMVAMKGGQIGPREFSPNLYKLTDKGRALAGQEEQARPTIPATQIMAAMDMVVGFEKIKKRIAYAIESGKRIHFLLEGPPACAKSVLMEAVRVTVPEAQMVFGSGISAAGLSDLLFEKRPSVLLADEVDKMKRDAISVMLGLMEHGEIIETKYKRTRGLKLDCVVIAACNGVSKMMTKEFLSRFAWHPVLKPYTRDEFMNVCLTMLGPRGCSEDLAQRIGAAVFDYRLGDVRKARSVWDMATAKPAGMEVTEADVLEVLEDMKSYSNAAAPAPRRLMTPALL